MQRLPNSDVTDRGEILRQDAVIDCARLSDLSAVQALAESRSLARTPAGEATRRGFLVSGYHLEDYQDLLERAEHFYVAHDADRLVGFVIAYSRERIGQSEWLNQQLGSYFDDFIVVKQICVDDTEASRGVATDLYQHVIDRSPPVPIVAAVVADPPNDASAALHRKLGFTPSISLTPPDGMPRVVWVRRPEQPGLLREQLSLAIDLYKHEDNLNWNKVNNYLYVTTACVALMGFAFSRSGNARHYATLVTSVLGIISSAGFGITIWTGVAYLHARKDTVREIEILLYQHGGFPVLAGRPGPSSSSRLERILARSPTATVLRTLPVLTLVGWLVILGLSLGSLL